MEFKFLKLRIINFNKQEDSNKSVYMLILVTMEASPLQIKIQFKKRALHMEELSAKLSR
jgi:hypothetical protein